MSVSTLSFVSDAFTGNTGRCFWNVKPTGRYGEDCRTGSRLAVEYLAFEEANPESGGILPSIVRDMPRELTGIEVSFLQLVCLQAREARGRARRITEQWAQAA